VTTTSACVQVFGRRDDGLTTDCGGRRPKSAKARSRGKLGTGGATRYGDLMAAPISKLDVTPTGRGRGATVQGGRQSRGTAQDGLAAFASPQLCDPSAKAGIANCAGVLLVFGVREPPKTIKASEAAASGFSVLTTVQALTGKMRALMRVGRWRSAIPSFTSRVTSSALCASWASSP
jgi:hypothetical protein